MYMFFSIHIAFYQDSKNTHIAEPDMKLRELSFLILLERFGFLQFMEFCYFLFSSILNSAGI
jgi:hypothetical protein